MQDVCPWRRGCQAAQGTLISPDCPLWPLASSLSLAVIPRRPLVRGHLGGVPSRWQNPEESLRVLKVLSHLRILSSSCNFVGRDGHQNVTAPPCRNTSSLGEIENLSLHDIPVQQAGKETRFQSHKCENSLGLEQLTQEHMVVRFASAEWSDQERKLVPKFTLVSSGFGDRISAWMEGN